MNPRNLILSGLVQLLAVVALSLLLGLLLPKSFFESWGWLSGPAAWLACAALTARILRFDLTRTLAGAVLAGLPAAVAVLLGIHWLGVLVAIVLFAAWCGSGRADTAGGPPGR